MTKRKDDLAKKMQPSGQSPGWKDQIGISGKESQKTSAANYKRKTYLITPAMIQRVKATAQYHQVGQNELVRFLLGWALDQLDTGDLELPLEQTYHIKVE